MIRKLPAFFVVLAALIGPALISPVWADAPSVRVVVPVRDIARGEVIWPTSTRRSAGGGGTAGLLR